MHQDTINYLNKFDPGSLASDLVDYAASVDGGQKFGKDTLHLFCAPVFVKAMCALFEKNIATTSCGSGKERNILPGITGLYALLSDKNKEVAKDMLISDTEFRIGARIETATTFAEFETKLLEKVNFFKKQ